MSILSLPTFALVVITIIASIIFSIIFYYMVHPFWSKELNEDTKKTAELVSTRTGIVYALVIGMMFANVREEHTEMIAAIENEASALASLYKAVKRHSHNEQESVEIQAKLIKYIEHIVNEQWPAIREARVQPEDRELIGYIQLDEIWDYVTEIEKKSGNLLLSNLLNEAEHNSMLRLFDRKGNLLPLFWYIAIFGYLVTLIAFYVYPPTLRRCALVSLYSSMVALVLLGIFIMSHPYSVAAGIEPDVFKDLLRTSASIQN